MTRLLDILFSFTILISISPILVPVMLILRFTGEGHIFYFQDRIGLNGKKFSIIKFATMLKNSPSMSGAFITTSGDPRILPFGKFLRKSKINELPQLINILKGDMSFVGPRPQVKSHLDMYPPEKAKEILMVQPGLTGIASLFFRDEEEMISRSSLDPKEFYRQFIVPYKVELELWYKEHRNAGVYFLLIALTAWSVIFSRSNLYTLVFKDLPKPPPELLLKNPS